MRRLVQTLVFFCLVIGGSTTAWAHKVNIFAYAENGKVYTESYFADGQMVIGARIEVVDAGGNKLLEGTTDAKGLFAFPLERKQTLEIIVNAGMGHKNSYVLKAEEM